ncbi:hypothetical protein L1887_30979 [Cichorium endivia]|nr:hypothetical protein L1887_30979 [Cichorium endivia]
MKRMDKNMNKKAFILSTIFLFGATVSLINGSVSPSISNLSHLTALNLANNSFSDEIPNLNIPNLQVLDISNNNLTGLVTQSLQQFPSSSFTGNNLSPLSSPPAVLSPASQPSTKSSKLGEPVILGIAIGGCALVFVLTGMEALCSSKAVALRLTLRICLGHRWKCLVREHLV